MYTVQLYIATVVKSSVKLSRVQVQFLARATMASRTPRASFLRVGTQSYQLMTIKSLVSAEKNASSFKQEERRSRKIESSQNAYAVIRTVEVRRRGSESAL